MLTVNWERRVLRLRLGSSGVFTHPFSFFEPDKAGSRGRNSSQLQQSAPWWALVYIFNIGLDGSTIKSLGLLDRSRVCMAVVSRRI